MLAAPAARLDTMPGGEFLRGQDDDEAFKRALMEAPRLTLGWYAYKWSIKYLVQPNGPRARQRYTPTRRQLLFWLHWYGLNEDGTWIYNHGVRRLAKGSGKSPNAAVWALVELCAPVRLLDFDPKAPGGVVGQPVSMPWVQIAAVAESQTENTMRMVRAFAKKGSRVVADHCLDPGLKLYHKLDDGGKLETLTSSSTSAEGAEATAIVGDETEHWLGKGGEEFVNTLADNVSKSGSRMIETCNSWKPGIGSVAEATFRDWEDQEERIAAKGDTKSGSKILYDARIAPADTDLTDRDSLMRALEWVYDDCWWVNPAGRSQPADRRARRASRADTGGDAAARRAARCAGLGSAGDRTRRSSVDSFLPVGGVTPAPGLRGALAIACASSLAPSGVRA